MLSFNFWRGRSSLARVTQKNNALRLGYFHAPYPSPPFPPFFLWAGQPPPALPAPVYPSIHNMHRQRFADCWASMMDELPHTYAWFRTDTLAWPNP